MNVTLKPLPPTSNKPLKIPPLTDLSEHFAQIRNSTPYSFVDSDSTHITICGLTPRISQQKLLVICSEFGRVEEVRLWAYYREFKATIVAHVHYETSAAAKHAFLELQQKAESGFAFQIYFGCGLRVPSQKIRIPNSCIRAVIDRVARMVVQDGGGLECALRAKEANNPEFAFLMIPSEEYEYYRWKVYSLLNGDTEKSWKTDPYQISLNGRVYRPPDLENEDQTTSLVKKELEKAMMLKEKKSSTGVNVLSDEDRLLFSNMIRELNTQKQTIGKAMVFCFDHSQSSADIVLIVSDSFNTPCPWNVKLARLYLISDILHNSGAQCYLYKTYLQWYLPQIFTKIDELLPYKEKVLKLLSVWKDWNVFDQKYLKGLEMTFLEPIRNIVCTAAKLYQEKLSKLDSSSLERLCRSRGLPTLDMVRRLVQHKFYNRTQVDVTHDQLQKYLQVYRHLLDKDQQGILASQKQSFSKQVELMQEFLHFLQKRYMNIVDDEQGEEFDSFDEKLYDIPRHLEHQRVERALYLSMDGSDLTDADIKQIEEKKVQVISNYEINNLFTKPPLPPLPTDPIEAEVQKYREKLFSKGIHNPMRIEEFVRAKRNIMQRIEQIKRDKERQQHLQQQHQQHLQQQQSMYQQKYQNNNKGYQTNYRRRQDSSSESGNQVREILDRRRHDKKNKHYKRKSRSRSDSRKRKQYSRRK